MKKLIFLSFALIFLSACNNDDTVSCYSDSNCKDNISYHAHFISVADALQNAEEMFNAISENTRSRTVSKVQTITKMVTRGYENSELPDTLYYVVNYGLEDGFAILGADDRFEAVYAISDEGRLNAEDLDTMPGLILFKQNMLNDMEDRIEANDIVIGINPPYETKYQKYGPYLSVKQRKWHQGYPFNDLCDINYTLGIVYNAGCVPIAVATMMAYYSWPEQYNGCYYNWDYINNDDTDFSYTEYIVRDVRRKENLDVYHTYEDMAKTNATSADYHNVKRTFQNMGYAVYGDFSYFKTYEVTEELKYRPLLMRGKGKEYVPFEYPEDDEDWDGEEDYGEPTTAHMWIVDGFYRQLQYVNGRYLETQSMPAYYHCVWGWKYSLANGYFKWGGKSGFGPMPDSKDDTDPNYGGKNVYHFYQDVKFLGVKPMQ